MNVQFSSFHPLYIHNVIKERKNFASEYLLFKKFHACVFLSWVQFYEMQLAKKLAPTTMVKHLFVFFHATHLLLLLLLV
jgi:hypothetical protein